MARRARAMLCAALLVLVGCGNETKSPPESAETTAAPADAGLDYVALGDSIVTTADVASTDHPTLYTQSLE